jgi:hypothetical protein
MMKSHIFLPQIFFLPDLDKSNQKKKWNVDYTD